MNTVVIPFRGTSDLRIQVLEFNFRSFGFLDTSLPEESSNSLSDTHTFLVPVFSCVSEVTKSFLLISIELF